MRTSITDGGINTGMFVSLTVVIVLEGGPRLRSSALLAVTAEEAREPWERQHRDAATQCVHRQRKFHCGNSPLDGGPFKGI